MDATLAGNFDVAIALITSTKRASPTGFSNHEDAKLDPAMPEP
jgi:hypothetical protein